MFLFSYQNVRANHSDAAKGGVRCSFMLLHQRPAPADLKRWP